MKKGTWIRISIYILMLVTFSYALGGNRSMNKEENTLLERDRAFSAASKAAGILVAYPRFMAEDGILLPLKGHPVYGKSTCEAMAKSKSVKRFEWEPLIAKTSGAVDLGYTHGRFIRPGTTKKELTANDYGYYFTVWKKQNNRWTIVFSQGLLLHRSLGQPAPGKDKKIDEAAANDVIKIALASERAFSAYSKTHGIAPAFHRFIADTGIALSSRGAPNTKKIFAAAIENAKKQPADKKVPQPTLTWEPMYSFAAASGDMAFNYGPFILEVPVPGKKNQIIRGYFSTIWKKQEDNSWKFLIDGGNEL